MEGLQAFLWGSLFLPMVFMPEVGKIDNVATPLLEECDDDTHILEMGTWESSGTSKTSKFDCRGQNTSL
jgi:hypothetical protein